MKSYTIKNIYNKNTRENKKKQKNNNKNQQQRNTQKYTKNTRNKSNTQNKTMSVVVAGRILNIIYLLFVWWCVTSSDIYMYCVMYNKLWKIMIIAGIQAIFRFLIICDGILRRARIIARGKN